jgi:hypothetical protein
MSLLSASTPFALAFLLSFQIPGCNDDRVADAPFEEPRGPDDGDGANPPDDLPPEDPHGGVPEPGTVLLVSGSAMGYLALRRRRKAARQA